MMNEFFMWLDAIAQQHPMTAYGVLFLSAIVENLFPPVPGDTVTVFGAYLVGRGALELWPVILSTFLGSAFGFMVLYWLGYHYGRAFILKLRWVKPEDIEKAEGLVQRKGIAVVAVNRFLPGLRSVISLAAGTVRLAPWQVFLATMLSVFCWNGVLIWLGFLFGDNWQQVMEHIGSYNRIMLVVLAALGIFVGTYILRKRRRAKHHDSATVEPPDSEDDPRKESK